MPSFSKSDRVRLRAEPTRAGVVLDSKPYDGGWTHEVFFSATEQSWINEAALEWEVPSREVQVVSRDEFLRSLLLTKLRNPLNDMFYAYQGSRTQFEAYQFKPVLKLLDSPVPALLIADEVGLGKTIEAAIIFEELKARGSVRRVLVVCPAGLREKWQAELLTRFDEQFTIMWRRDLERDAKLYRDSEGSNALLGIVSLESFRAESVQDALRDAGVTFDLVIIDEAHHLRTTGTLSNAVGEQMRAMSEYLILLTATPLQTGQRDLFNLIQFLDPVQFSQYDDFMLQLQPNARLNAAIRSLRDTPPAYEVATAEIYAIDALPAAAQVTHHPTYPLVIKALASDRPIAMTSCDSDATSTP